jgi:hypothetical protein
MSAVVSEKASAKKTGTSGAVWAGRVISGIGVLGLLMSASMKFAHKPEAVAMFVGKFGYPESSMLYLGIIELTCVVLYLIPRTSIFGAVIATGYLGGAVATHVRVGDPFIAPIVVATLLWLGAFLRDDRVREIIRPKTGAPAKS